ncbi:UDP-N-acetylmuramate--L-alanine ligase [Niabella terrae]
MNQKGNHIDALKAVYFIGIGGIGMSAIARYFNSRGITVSGYDRTETAMTRQLEAEGIRLRYQADIATAPKEVDYVIYTPAIPADHPELVYYQQQGYPVVKRSDILKLITESSFNICVAGTHGKTTTSTMVAHILRDSGYGCNAFLGGVSANYQTNFWSDERNVCVIEADEYDRSFLKLSPDIAVVIAADADHLDIYGTPEQVAEAYRAFAGRVKPGGLLLKKFGLDRRMEADRVFSYSLQNESADIYGARIELQDGGYRFDAVLPGRTIEGVELSMGGMHNVENCMAAIAVADALDISAEAIRSAVAGFRGVKRRFEYLIKTPELVFIDDYAHHPEELKALIRGVKTLFPQRRCTLVFQPHLFSRTRDFAEEFAAVLDEADSVKLLPVYPARELPVAGVSSALILDRMTLEHKEVLTAAELLTWAEKFNASRNREFGEVLVLAGAGDIDKLTEPIKQILSK